MNETGEYVTFLLGFVLISVLVLGYWTALVRRANRRGAGFQRAARLLKGTVSRDDSLMPQALHFTIEGRPAVIEFERGGAPSTRVKVAMFRRSPGVCRILPTNVARERTRFAGAPDIRIGDARFDTNWFVTARPESFAHRLFAEDRRGQVIQSVRRLVPLGLSSIEITRDTLTIRVHGLLDGAEALHLLAQTAKDFVGYILRLGPEEGIAWVAAGAGEPEVGLCPVCAVGMTEDVVLCDKCRTPHHLECWTYVGRCSTYACNGKSFTPGPVSGHDRGAAAS